MTTDLDVRTDAAATTTDADRAEQLVHRLLASYTAGSELLTIELGRRLGFYAHLDVAGPSTPAELAADAGVPERYAREWLEQQGAAGVLDVVGHGGERRFALPAGHAPVLLDPESPVHAVALAPLLVALARTLPEVAAAVRAGRGVEYGDYGPDLRSAIAGLNRPGFTHALAGWVAEMPDVAARLSRPATVLDLGCGEGWSAIAIARAFPAARVVAIDLDAASVVQASRHVAAAGLTDRVRVVRANASDAAAVREATGGQVALVTAFQTLHDMGRPGAALAAARAVLEPGGAVLVGDEVGGEEYAAPGDDHDRLRYAVSVLHCLPATWAEDATHPNGTVVRPSTVRRWSAEAGFAAAVELPIEHPFWRFFRIS